MMGVPTYPISRRYPLLSIAKRYDLPYATVLLSCDAMIKRLRVPPEELNCWEQEAIMSLTWPKNICNEVTDLIREHVFPRLGLLP